jgi:parallel beta-helix repeat (two copies)
MIGTPRRVGASLLGLLGVGVLLVAFGAFDARSANAVGPTPSTTTLTSNVNPAVYGQSVTLTAVAAAVPPATARPTGTVTFFNGATSMATKTLSNGTASYTTTYPVGTKSFTTTYNGDTVYAVSTSPTLTEVVNQTPTTTTLASSANPSNLGNAVTFTATTQAAAPGAGTPSSGTIKFFDGATLLATKTPATGIATFLTSSLAIGNHSITAVFSGSASYLASTSAPLTETVSAAVTTTTLTSSPNPSSWGGGVTLAATVSSVAGTPTGTVSFTDGATALGTATLTSGQATITAPALAVGTHPITATYSGGASYLASVSAPVSHVVNRTVSTVGVTSAPNPSVNGSAFTVTATVASTAGTPTGTVTFTEGATALGSTALTGNVATVSVAGLGGGSHVITASYSGDSSFTASTSAPITEVIDPAPSTVALTSSANPSAFASSVTFTATVTSAAGTPTGTVVVNDGASVVGSSTLTSGQATITLSNLAVGTHPLTATYNGNVNFASSTSNPLAQVVDPASSTTAVTSSANPSGVGDPVTFAATVSSPSGSPTGTVAFTDGLQALGTANLSGGQASLTITNLSAGDHVITATYSGDSIVTASASAPLTQSVNAASTTTVTSSANPSIVGVAVTLTATVTGGPATATGTVTFRDATTVVGTAPLTNGAGAIITNTLSTGLHAITATYSGDASLGASTSAPLAQNVDAAPSTTTIGSSANPSIAGQPVTLTATVTGANGTPTGTMTFTDGPTTLGTATLTNGQAMLGGVTFSAGSHTLVAAYSGDLAFGSSASAPLTQTVVPTTVTTIASSANPSTFGQAVTLTATVTGASGTPTGTMTFTDGLTTLGTATLTNGQATFTTAANLGAGNHLLTAAYSGDGSFVPSTSSTLTQVVDHAASATTLGSGTNPSTFGQAVTLTATVSSTGGTPTGTVTFAEGATTLGTAAVTNGSGTLTVGALTAGLHSITASYSGDATFGTSTSAALSQAVNPAATAITLASNVNPSSFGTAVGYMATVTSAAGTPAGLVSLSDGSTLLGNANLTNGTATITISTLSVGTHTLTASYGATVGYSAGTSAALVQTVLATTTTTISSSANPSTYGQAVTLTATVGAANGTPTGVVTFFAGATPLGTGSLTNGQASLSVGTLSAGSRSITGAYSGDASNGPSTSAPITQTVNPAASAISLTVGPNPAISGQPVTVATTVSSASGVPTGTVTVRDATTVIATLPLSNGQASFAISSLGIGAHTLSAVFEGNPNVSVSFSAGVTETIVATTISVDKANASCKNTGAGAGSLTTPYCSINSAAAKVVPGQTVQVAAGVYSERVTVAVGGSQTQPVTFAPAPGASVAITGVVNGFTMSGKSWVTIRGFDVNHTSGVGISVTNSSNVTIDANHVSYAGLPISGSTATGIKLNGSTASSVINNITDHNSDAGILITTSADSNVIAHNESFANARGYVRAAAGIDLRSSTGEVVFDNVSHDNEDSGINVWTGLTDGSSTVYDNVTYSNGDHGIDVHNSVDAHIVANTVYNNSDSGIEMTTSVHVTLNNNVSVDNGINSPRTAGEVRADVASVSGGCVIQDDLVFLRTPGIMFDWNGVKYSSLAALQSATGMESRGIQADPRFTSAPGGNFRLLAGSPAIDTANTSAAGQPSVDFDGGSRFDDPATLNTGIGPITFADRGAFEYHP